MKNAKKKYTIHDNVIDWLPKIPYQAGVPTDVVFHDTGNDRSTIDGEIKYMTNNYKDAFVHAWIDADNIKETANTDYVCWGAGPGINGRAIQGELVREHNKVDFYRSLDRWIFYFAFQCYWYDIKPKDATKNGKGTVWTHKAVSQFIGYTDHTDPIGYLEKWGVKWSQVYDKMVEYYEALQKGDSRKVKMIGSAYVRSKTKKKAAISKAAKKPVTKNKMTKVKVHKVVKGDSLWKLSRKYDVTVDELKKWNKLKTNELFIDMNILVSKPVVVKKKVATKKKAPVKVNSTMRTKQEMLDKVKWYKGKEIDFDLAWGEQCMDVAVDYVWWLTAKSPTPYRLKGDARDTADTTVNQLPEKYFTLYENTPEFMPQVGDIIVYSKDWADNEWGHIGIVYGNVTLDHCDVIEANWDGDGSGPCEVRRENGYVGVSFFVRPKVI